VTWKGKRKREKPPSPSNTMQPPSRDLSPLTRPAFYYYYWKPFSIILDTHTHTHTHTHPTPPNPNFHPYTHLRTSRCPSWRYWRELKAWLGGHPSCFPLAIGTSITHRRLHLSQCVPSPASFPSPQKVYLPTRLSGYLVYSYGHTARDYNLRFGV